MSLAVFAAVALAAGVGTASAQSTTTTTTTTISPDQETTIYRTITHEQVAVQPPPEWAPSVGIEVPAQVQLYDMPSTIDVPTVRSDRYTVVNGHVVLVDPGTRRVVRVIER
jgi:hypothetical protein